MSILHIKANSFRFLPTATVFSSLKEALWQRWQIFTAVPDGLNAPTCWAQATRIPVCNIRGAVTEVELHPKQVWYNAADNRWRMIICRGGQIWVTQAGDPHDYVLKAGEMFIITLPGLVVVQALQDAHLQITPSLKAVPFAGDFGKMVFH